MLIHDFLDSFNCDSGFVPCLAFYPVLYLSSCRSFCFVVVVLTVFADSVAVVVAGFIWLVHLWRSYMGS